MKKTYLHVILKTNKIYFNYKNKKKKVGAYYSTFFFFWKHKMYPGYDQLD
jgi:hypothetical protein